jgi:predicted ATPase/DNA-binding CsgD family transcriptional regulator
VAPTLLEREAVLADMQALARTAATGAGQVLLLRGEAGVGRSALIRRFLGVVADRAEVLLGRCDPLSTPRPLGPVIDMCHRLPDAVAAELEAAIDARNSEAVYRHLLRVLRDGHVWVCVIEDAHWADDATLDLLRFLARRIDTLPVLAVVSYRDYELGPSHPFTAMLGDMSNHASLTRISLSPLSSEAVGVMAASTETDPEHLYMLTGGNPFYLNEILAANSVGSGGEALPRSVIESASGRLARLSEVAREAAEVVAVCGPDADPRFVQALCSGAMVGLNECVRAGLLVSSDEVVRFRHELVRLAILEQIPSYVRSGIHKSALAARSQTSADSRQSAVRHPDRQAITAGPLADTHPQRAETRADLGHLTRREREILELLAVGHSDAEIANRLFISQRTVNNHVHAILNKLGAHNRTQAATYARVQSTGTIAPEAVEG